MIPLALFAFTLPLPLVLQLVLAVVLPLLVGLVTTRVTEAHVKALVLLALSIVSSGITDLIATIQAGTMFDLGLWAISALTTFGLGVALHFGLYKPTGLSDAAQRTLVKAEPLRDPDSGRFV